jgi:membrane-associated phospholipid phosphatase
MAALLLLTTLSLQAAEPAVVRALREEGKRYVTDARDIARAPLHWDERTWKQVALIVAADGALFAVDRDIADVFQRNRTAGKDDVLDLVTPFGGGRGSQVAGAALIAGMLLHKPELRDTGHDALEASLFAAVIVTPALKQIARRTRPNGGDLSFPSGHATNAFAVASVFAAHSKGRVVPVVAYTLASAVAVARLNDNVHYTSDVFAGAVIGTAIGRSLVSRHRRAAATPRVAWTIVPVQRGLALQVAVAPETLVRFAHLHRF